MVEVHRIGTSWSAELNQNVFIVVFSCAENTSTAFTVIFEPRRG